MPKAPGKSWNSSRGIEVESYIGDPAASVREPGLSNCLSKVGKIVQAILILENGLAGCSISLTFSQI